MKKELILEERLNEGMRIFGQRYSQHHDDDLLLSRSMNLKYQLQKKIFLIDTEGFAGKKLWKQIKRGEEL